MRYRFVLAFGIISNYFYLEERRGRKRDRGRGGRNKQRVCSMRYRFILAFGIISN